MGTTTDKLNHIINTKEGIRQEINRAYNTEEISTSDTFNSYIQKLEEHPFYLKKLVEGTVESIKLSNVTSIGQSAFRTCSSLTTIYVGTESDTICTLSSRFAFSGCTNLTNIYVPESLVDSYKSATNWSSFASKIKATP